MKTAEHRITQPEILSNLFTKPYVFVPQSTILHALGLAEDDKGGNGISRVLLSVTRREFHKRVFALRDVGGACWVPDEGLKEFSIENFRPVPESVARLPKDQRHACEILWPNLKRVTFYTVRVNGKTTEALRPVLPEKRYQALEEMVRVIAASPNHSAGWSDLCDWNTHYFDLTAFYVLLSRLNAFMAEGDIPVRLAPTHVEKYNYIFKSL